MTFAVLHEQDLGLLPFALRVIKTCDIISASFILLPKRWGICHLVSIYIIIAALSSPQQPAALCTNPSVCGSHTSVNTDPLQRNYNVLANHNEFVGGQPDNSGGSQVAFGEIRVPYQINKFHANHYCILCIKFNPSDSFISSSTNRNWDNSSILYFCNKLRYF